MRFDSEVYLIGNTHSKNRIGDNITTPSKRQVLAEKKSVRQSETYQAAATGLKPELMFVMWVQEYHGENELKYKGKNYTIIRTYQPNDKEIELICSGLVGGPSG